MQCNGNTRSISSFTIGDNITPIDFDWCIASAYIISQPIGVYHRFVFHTDLIRSTSVDDDLVRFIHYLGPRYALKFQSESLGRFYTYEASTACNIFLTEQATKKANRVVEIARFGKLLKDGPGLSETSFIVIVTHAADIYAREEAGVVAMMKGDIFKVTDKCVDWAMWKIGGAAIPLRLVQLANVSLAYSCAVFCIIIPVFRALTSFRVLWVFWSMVCEIVGRIPRTWNAYVSVSSVAYLLQLSIVFCQVVTRSLPAF